MFRAKRLTKGRPERSRSTHGSSGSKSRDAERGASGRITKKTPQIRALSPTKKLESLRLKLAAKGIQYDRGHKQKNENSLPDAALYRQKMSVTPDPERKCTEDEMEKIQDAILNALEPLEDGCFPQFYGSYNVKGVLVMSCANKQTKLWLERTVPELQPWENGKLCVKPKGEVSQGTKVLFKTPKLFAKTDPKKILQMLSTQNKTLETNMWKNVDAKSEDTGQTLTFIVDNQSLEAIRALNNKLFLGLGSVELVILNDDEEGNKQNSADTDMKSEDKSDKKTSVDTEMKIKEAAHNQTSVDTEMKDQVENDKKTSEDVEMKNKGNDKKPSEDMEMENEDSDKKTPEDTEMKNEDNDKKTSEDTVMKNEDSDKKTSEDTEMKNDEDKKQTSEDTEMKRLEEDDKQTSADTEMTPSERTSV